MLIKRFSIKKNFHLLVVILAVFWSSGILSAENSVYERIKITDFLNSVCPHDANHEFVVNVYGDEYNHEFKEIGINRADYYYYNNVGRFIFYTKGSDDHESIYYWELERPFLNEKFGFYNLKDIWNVLGPPDYWSESEIRYSAAFDYLIFYFVNGEVVSAEWAGYSD